jgi:xanthine dehydrogenase accessory factor
MSFLAPTLAPGRAPLSTLAERRGPGALAIITGVEGPSYRPVGAAMAIMETGERAGTLSSGCIEADIALHAREALAAGVPRAVRYGRGSPFRDIELPCGGGLDILLVPEPDREMLRAVVRRQEARVPVTLAIDPETGAHALHDTGETGWREGRFQVRQVPPLRFHVFGKGPEACTFAALVQSAGYPNTLLSPDEETLATAAALGCDTRHLTHAGFPEDLAVDPWTAVVLFFHDHDWEPPILAGALETPAFYIGAQGSRRARDARLLTLEAMGVGADARARLHGPVGLIPSARDAGTLAVSVLAEILAVAQTAPAG